MSLSVQESLVKSLCFSPHSGSVLPWAHWSCLSDGEPLLYPISSSLRSVWERISNSSLPGWKRNQYSCPPYTLSPSMLCTCGAISCKNDLELFVKEAQSYMWYFSPRQTKRWGTQDVPTSRHTHVFSSFQNSHKELASCLVLNPHRMSADGKRHSKAATWFLFISLLSVSVMNLSHPANNWGHRISSKALHPFFSKALLSQHSPTHLQTEVPLGQLPVGISQL